MKRLASRTRSAIYAILGAVSLLLVMKRVVLRDGADVNNNPVVVSSENAENSTAKKCRPPITTSNDTSAELDSFWCEMWEWLVDLGCSHNRYSSVAPAGQ